MALTSRTATRNSLLVLFETAAVMSENIRGALCWIGLVGEESQETLLPSRCVLLALVS
jgi:hypothetical protein